MTGSPNSQGSNDFQADRLAAMRVMDANRNRAQEGLRVVEEFVRFVLDDTHLTDQYKRLRHDLQAALAAQASPPYALARDTLADVGTEIATDSEYARKTTMDVASASQQRAEQAMRALEEYSKILDPATSERIEQLRYRLYTLGRAWMATSISRERLVDCHLQVLIGGQDTLDELLRLAGRILQGGADMLQLREKDLSDAQLLERARALRDVTRRHDALLVINDRPDISRLVRADGVHLGQDDLPIREARAIVGPRALIGRSTHDLDQARQAVLEGADYIGCGPTFPSQTKSFAQFAGIGFLKEVAKEISLPAFAIGGITEQNVGEVMAVGITRIAVSGTVVRAEDPAEAASRLKKILADAAAKR